MIPAPFGRWSLTSANLDHPRSDEDILALFTDHEETRPHD